MYIFFLLFAAEKNDEQLFLYFGLYINFLFRFLPSLDERKINFNSIMEFCFSYYN